MRDLFKGGLIICGLSMVMAFADPEVQQVEDAPVEEASPMCYMENKAFQAGEMITYKLYYNWNFVWLAAGEVTFKVTEEGAQYHLSATGTTYASYEWFYKVRDSYDSYVDKTTLLPNMSVREVAEGGYRVYDKVTFDQNKKKAFSLRGKTKETVKRKDFALGDCMHDMLSIIYYTRNLDFGSYRAGQEFPVKVFLDQEIYPLKVKYLGKEVKTIKDNGKFNTIKFSPEVIAGEVFKQGDEMSVWATDDQNKIPLMIESPVSVGSVKAVLKSYSGLRYNFTSKLRK